MGKVKEQTILSNDAMAIGLAEVRIRFDKKLYENFSTGNKTSDFTINDIVKCTYLKGLFRVVCCGIYGTVTLNTLNSKETTCISADFLKKVAANTKTLKVLYGS